MNDTLDNDFNETETREFITDALKSKGWKLKLNMRYEYKITDGRVQIDEEGDSFRDEALYADYLLFAPNNQPLCVVEAKRANQVEGTGIQQAINYCNLLNAPFAASSNGKSFVFTSLLNGHEGTNDNTAFVKYILGIVLSAYRDFEDRLNLIEDKISAYEMVERVIKNQLGKFTKSDIQEYCPTLARQTIEKALKQLCDESKIEKHGQASRTFYIRKSI